MKKKELVTNVNSKLDFTITKDDILLVLLSDKEQELKKELEVIELSIKSQETTLNKLKSHIEDVIRKDLSLKKDDKFDILTTNYNQCEHYVEYALYDINRLSQMKNPSLVKDKKIRQRQPLYSLHNKVVVSRKLNKDGFEGTLTKIFKIDTTKYKGFLDNFNELYKQSKLLNEELSYCQYQLLILDTDKSIKSNLIKKIVNTSDYSKLFLESKEK